MHRLNDQCRTSAWVSNIGDDHYALDKATTSGKCLVANVMWLVKPHMYSLLWLYVLSKHSSSSWQ